MVLRIFIHRARPALDSDRSANVRASLFDIPGSLIASELVHSPSGSNDDAKVLAEIAMLRCEYPWRSQDRVGSGLLERCERSLL